MPGLAASDFDVKVAGAPRRVTTMRYEPTTESLQPSSVLVAVDRQNLRMETSRATLDAAATFVETLPPPHAVGLIVLPDEKLRISIGQPASDVTKALRELLGTFNPRMPMGEDGLSARSRSARALMYAPGGSS